MERLLNDKMDIILIGGFSELFELCEECNYNILGYVDNHQFNKELSVYPYKYFGDDDSFPFSKFSNEAGFIISPDNPLNRERLAEKLKIYGLKYINLISPNAKISRSSLLGTGIVIQYGCNISSLTRIGDFVKINTYANIMHNVQIGDYTTVAPNAIILGFVNIKSKCYIGANASILPRINICSNVIIGAGAVVTKDITEPGTYVGIPARRIK